MGGFFACGTFFQWRCRLTGETSGPHTCCPPSKAVSLILARYLPLRSFIFTEYLPESFVDVVLTFLHPLLDLRWIVTLTSWVQPDGAAPSLETVPEALRCLASLSDTNRACSIGCGSGLGEGEGLADALGDGEGLAEGDGEAEGDADGLAEGEGDAVGHSGLTGWTEQFGDEVGEGDGDALVVAEPLGDGVGVCEASDTVNVEGVHSSPRPRPVHSITYAPAASGRKLRVSPFGTGIEPGSLVPPNTGAGSISMVLSAPLLLVTWIVSAVVGVPELLNWPRVSRVNV